MGFNEVSIQPPINSEEKYNTQKRKMFKVAKRIYIMGEIMSLSVFNVFFSLGLFLLSAIGTELISYLFAIDINSDSETFIFRGGFFITICGVYLIIFTISGLWWAIGNKRVEIMCIFLDNILTGTSEINELNQNDNLLGRLAQKTGLLLKNDDFISRASHMVDDYLNKNNTKMKINKTFKILKILLILGQILFALVGFGILLK